MSKEKEKNLNILILTSITKEDINEMENNNHKHLENKNNREDFELNSYNSDEDIENQHFIHVTKSQNSDSQSQQITNQIFEQNIKEKSKRRISVIDKKEIFQNIISFRILNSISILILISTFIFVSFNRLNNPNYLLIVEHLKHSNIQSEYNLLILNFSFCLLTSKII